MSKEMVKNHKYHTRSKNPDKKDKNIVIKNKKMNYDSSSSSDDSNYNSESDYTSCSDEEEELQEEEKFDIQDYRKFIADLYPSKYSEKRAKNTSKLIKS